MTDSMRELHDLERRHDAVMVAISDMRAKIDRQKNRILAEAESYRTLEKQAITLYDAESEMAAKIRRLRSEHDQA